MATWRRLAYIDDTFTSLLLDPSPTIAGHVEGRIYYDEVWKTLSANISTDVTLNIGQEDLRMIYNDTGVTIHNGYTIYINGVYTAGTNDVPTVAKAKADAAATALVAGIATQEIADESYGLVSIRGNVNDIDTMSIGAAWLLSQNIILALKIGGVAGNANTFEVVNSGSGGLSFTDAEALVVQLGGTTPTASQVVTLLDTSTLYRAALAGPDDAVIVAGAVSFANGVDVAEGDILYLSPTIAGMYDNVIPEAPNLQVKVGRLITKHATAGRIWVDIQQVLRLNDLADVSVPSPVVDNVLKFDGNDWVPGSGVTVSGAMGVEFFSDDTTILAVTPTLASNRRLVESLLKSPTATGQQAEAWTTTSALVFGEAYLYNAALTRDKLDAGVWTFDIYCSTSSINSSPQLDQNIYRVIQGVGTLSTVRTSTTLQATSASGTPFISEDGTADLSTCSYLQTPKGLFEITVGAVGADAKKATAVCLAAYGADETDIPAGDWKVWRKLFGVNTGNITNITPAYGLVAKQSVQPEIALTADLSDRLGSILFARSTNTGRIITYVHNGANYASHFQTPLITLHNNLAGLNLGNYQHLTSAQLSALHAAVTVSAPIVLSGQAIELKNNAGSPAQVTAIDIGALANSDTVVPTSKAVATAISDGRAIYYGTDATPPAGTYADGAIYIQHEA